MNLRAFRLIVVTMMLTIFLASMVDVCVEDCESSAPISQVHHCCVQCCPVRNLGPASNYSVSLKSFAEISLGYCLDASRFFQGPFPDSLYRPPIV